MANKVVLARIGAGILSVLKWAKAKLTVFFGWVSDLWTDTHKQADVRIIAADICVGAEVVLVLGFVKNIATLQVLSGVFYLAVMILIGVAGLVLLKQSKDALDKR